MGSNPSKSSERAQTLNATPQSSPDRAQTHNAMSQDKPSSTQNQPSLEPKISEAERQVHVKNMKKLKDTIKHVKNDKRKETNNKYLESYAEQLAATAEAYFSAGIDNDIFRLEISRELATSGTVTILCDVAVDVYGIGFVAEDDDIDGNNFTALEGALSALTNFSDADQENTPIICDHPTFLEKTAQYLRKLKDKTKNDTEASLIDAILSIIHNVAMFDNNVSKVRSFNYVEVLTPYLESPINNARLIAIAAMADIVNEEESEILQKGQDILGFLKKVLKTSMNADNRMHPWLSWPVWELTRIMRKIARNDTNKKALANQGFLPLLVEIANSSDLREQREAIGTLWTLSFDKEIRKSMVADTNLADVFVSKRNSADPEISKASRGALWTMREELSVTEKYKDLDIVKAFAEHKAIEEDRKKAESAKGHVMVSYQWSNQQILINVRDQLRSNGFKVWMDIDDMAGSTLEAMAKAVEEAEVVLICYSKKYKDSDNCRAEAEYAFEKRKPIVPLRMEQGYKADGWLGIIIGAKKFYDYSGKYSFDSRTDDLVKELRGRFSTYQEIVPQNAVQLYHEPMALTSSSNEVHSAMGSNSDVKLWTSLQVTQWLDKHGLDRSKFGKLHGVEIAYLQFLMDRSPDYFNKALIDQLKIKDLLTMAKFTFALADTNI